MTFDEMRYEAEVLFESITSDAAPGFTDEEWGVILTAAQRKIVLRILQEGIARDIVNSLQLTALVNVNTITDFTDDTYYLNSDGTSAQTVATNIDNFDAETFWVLDEYVATSSYDRIPLHRKTYEYYQKNIDNPYSNPDPIEGFWILSLQDENSGDAQSRPVFITDGSTITSYKYISVKHPDYYDIASGSDCVLHESLHGDIVSLAVKLAHQSVIDPNGFQIAVAADQLQN